MSAFSSTVARLSSVRLRKAKPTESLRNDSNERWEDLTYFLPHVRFRSREPWTRAWTSLPAPVTALRETPISVSSRDGASTRTKKAEMVYRIAGVTLQTMGIVYMSLKSPYLERRIKLLCHDFLDRAISMATLLRIQPFSNASL